MPMNPRLLRPRAAGGFDPRTIAGLEAWWDAADSASVTLDSGRVAEFRDKSGKARHFANSTSGSTQPDYITAGRNGRNLIRFASASAQQMSVPSSTAAFNFLHNGTPSMVVAVASFGASDNPNTIHTLIANQTQGSGQRGFLIGFDDRTSLSRNNAFFVSCLIGSAFTSAYAAQVNDLLPAQTFLVMQAVIFTASSPVSERLILSVNGGAESKPNTQTGAASAGDASNDLFLGQYPNGTFRLSGDVCELLLFSQIPTAGARQSLRQYLGAKWGITVA